MVHYCVHRDSGWFTGDYRNRYGKQMVWLSNIRCNGTETSVLNCQHNGWSSGSCQTGVSISCVAGIIASTLWSTTYVIIFYYVEPLVYATIIHSLSCWFKAESEHVMVYNIEKICLIA